MASIKNFKLNLSQIWPLYHSASMAAIIEFEKSMFCFSKFYLKSSKLTHKYDKTWKRNVVWFVLTITMIFQNFLSNLREVTNFNLSFHCWRRLPPRSYLYQNKLWSLYFKIPKRTAPHSSAIHRISKSKLLILMKNFGHFLYFFKKWRLAPYGTGSESR